jgi:hypothetical protein
MAPANFELLMNLVGPKIVKRGTRFRTAIPVQERLAETLQFWATSDSYTCLQYLFQISKQTMLDCTRSVCEAIVEALMENIQVKIVYCTELTVLHLKSMVWNTETKYVTNKVLLITEL